MEGIIYPGTLVLKYLSYRIAFLPTVNRRHVTLYETAVGQYALPDEFGDRLRNIMTTLENLTAMPRNTMRKATTKSAQQALHP